MKYLPSPQVQAELIKAGLEQFCNGIDFEDADWNAQRDYFRSHPIHAKESDAEIDDRTGYFLIWRDHGVPQDKTSGDAVETVNAKRITVMHETLRELAREHFPALRQDFADVKNSTSIQANAAKMLGAQFSQYSDSVVTAGARNLLAIRAVQSAVSANASEARVGLDEVKTTVRDSLTHVAKIIGWGLGAIFALLLALAVMTAFSLRAHAQIDVIHIQQGGTDQAVFAAPFKLNFASGCTVSRSGSTASITCSGAAANPGGSSTQVQYNSAGTTFGGISTMTTDGTIVTAKVGADWLFVDPTGPTKKFSFDASNITAGQTRTVNVPDANSTTVQALSAVANTYVSGMSAQGVLSTAAIPVTSVASRTGAVTLTSTDVGLANVTNDAQTKAAIVPNTAPSSGQIPVGNAGGTAYAPQSLSQDCTLASTGVITCTKTNNVAFATSATTDTTNAANIGSGTLPAGRMPALTGAVTTSAGAVATSPGKIDVLDSSRFCQAAGASSTTYTCNLSPAITAYVTGTHYGFKADVANTAASTINLNGQGAKTIKKASGGITTDIVANDMQAGQWVDLVYDGTNMQMQSTLGNASAGSGTVTSIATTSPITGGTITNTGTIACATCVTSAASLTSNALVVGGGSQASAVLASLGTTTTVLHGNAAGLPSFAAVTSADTTGTFSPTAHNLLSASHGDTTAASPVLGDTLYASATPLWTKLAGTTTSGGGAFINETQGVLAVPAAPVLTGALTGGNLATGSQVCVVNTLVNAFGETTRSPETCITLNSGNNCASGSVCKVTVTAPTLSGNATGYTSYSSFTPGEEEQQAASAACVNISINCVISTLGAGIAPLSVNTASNGTTVIPTWVASNGTGTAVLQSTAIIKPLCVGSVCYADQFLQGVAGADCGARINAADAYLSTSGVEGEIAVNQNCGLTWTTAVLLNGLHHLHFVQGGTYSTSKGISSSTGGAVAISGPPAGAGIGGVGTLQTEVMLKETSGSNLPALITMNGAEDVVRDITVDCNKAGNPTGGVGILANKINRPDWGNVTVQNCPSHGLMLQSTLTGNDTNDANIRSVMAINNNGDGIYILNSADNAIGGFSQMEANGISATVNTTSTTITATAGSWSTDSSLVGTRFHVNDALLCIAAAIPSTTTITVGTCWNKDTGVATALTTLTGVTFAWGSGLELNNSPTTRLGGPGDIGGNRMDGILAYGTTLGLKASGLTIAGALQIGNNYQNDVEIQGYDTVNGGVVSQANLINSVQFYGSSNRTPNGIYCAIALTDGGINTITGNLISSLNAPNQLKGGICAGESAASRMVASTVGGNTFNGSYLTSKIVDTTAAGVGGYEVDVNGGGGTGNAFRLHDTTSGAGSPDWHMRVAAGILQFLDNSFTPRFQLNAGALSQLTSVALNGATSGSTTILPTAVAGSTTATLPANTGTVAELNLAQSWTDKQTFAGNGASNAAINIPSQTAPTSPVAGDIWQDTNEEKHVVQTSTAGAIKFYDSGGVNAITHTTSGTITSYTVNHPLAAATGVLTGVNASNVITWAHSGDAAHSISQLAKTAAVTTFTLCAATANTACGQAGQYRISYNFYGSGTACSSVTAGSVGLNLTWTDTNAVTHTTISLPLWDQKAAAMTNGLFNFNTALGTEGASGSYIISTNGTIIQAATTYTACTTGTGTYNLKMTVEQLQ